MLKQSILLLLILSALVGNTQEYHRSNSVIENKITYGELSDDEYGKKIFQILSIDNKTDARKLSLTAKYRLSTLLERNGNNNLQVSISISPVSLNGNINIREFALDTLLWPSRFTAELIIKNGRNNRGSIVIAGKADGTVNVIDLSDFNHNIGDVSVMVENIEYKFTRNTYEVLEEKAESIVYYYSYGLLLDKLIAEYTNKSVKADPKPEDIFLQKTELDRINTYIVSHSLNSSLNLLNRDPISFLKKIKKFERLRKRAHTLLSNQITKNNNESIGHLHFCNKYTSLSEKYIIASSGLQPSDASAFKEVAKLDIANGEKENLIVVQNYYRNGTSSSNFPQCIVEGFVALANGNIQDNIFTDALLYLNNAKAISSWFNTKANTAFKESVIKSISGVASSYLRVGYMALKSDKIGIGTQYIGSANELLIANNHILENILIADSSLMDIIKLQVDIAIEYSDKKLFTESLNNLEVARKICSHLIEQDSCYIIDTTTCFVQTNYMKNEIKVFEMLISAYQYPDAFDRFSILSTYFNEYSCSDTSVINDFNDLSYSLFLVFLQQGEILIDAKQPEAAIENLKLAKAIQQYLGGDLNNIDRLIEFTAEPLIVNVIDQAKYDTWANKLEDAGNKYDYASDLNLRYFKGSNNRVNESLSELNEQMELRMCLDHKNAFNDAIKTAQIKIKDKKYKELPELLAKAQEIYDTYPQCNIDPVELIKIRSDNTLILNFFKQYSKIKNELFNKGYGSVVEDYNSLENYYLDNNIAVYNVDFHNQYDFVKSQQLPSLTLEAIKYFLKIEMTETSLAYLKLYKSHGDDTKETKQLTSIIAKTLAKKDNEANRPASEALAIYTEGNAKLNYFKIVYLKNRVVKSSE